MWHLVRRIFSYPQMCFLRVETFVDHEASTRRFIFLSTPHCWFAAFAVFVLVRVVLRLLQKNPRNAPSPMSFPVLLTVVGTNARSPSFAFTPLGGGSFLHQERCWSLASARPSPLVSILLDFFSQVAPPIMFICAESCPDRVLQKFKGLSTPRFSYADFTAISFFFRMKPLVRCRDQPFGISKRACHPRTHPCHLFHRPHPTDPPRPGSSCSMLRFSPDGPLLTPGRRLVTSAPHLFFFPMDCRPLVVTFETFLFIQPWLARLSSLSPSKMLLYVFCSFPLCFFSEREARNRA